MSEDRKRLGETLALLREQLAAAEVSGELETQVVARLRATAGELEEALGGDRPTATAAASRSDYLTESLAHFEQSHPTLAGTVQQLIDLLSQMGI
jgi:molybdopterin converting factor small subunit